MTGAGAPGGPGIIKAILENQEIDLYIADASPNASGRFLLNDNFLLIPKANEDCFASTILDLCKKHKIEIIFPLVTKELFELARIKNDFLDHGIKVIVSDENALNIANNKCSLYNHLKKHNIPVPEFEVVDKVEDFKKAVKKFNHPTKPIVMKPCVGNGSRGIRVLDSDIDRFDMLFNHKPSSINSTLEEILTSIGNNPIPNILVSEYLPGKEITIDTIVAEGVVHDCLIRERITMRDGISTAGEFIESDEIESYIKSIVSTLPGLFGPVGFQVKKSLNSDYLLLESNPRIQGTSTAALGLGINLPLRAIDFALGKSLPLIKNKSGISFSRYYQEVFYES